MNAKAKDVALPQDEVVIEGSQAQVSAELRELADKKVKNLIGMWKERRKDQAARAESGGMITPVGYKYWDCLLLGPYQWTSIDRPAKVIAANDWSLLAGLIWVNPDRDPDGGVSGAEFFAGRSYNACFRAVGISDTLNVTSHLVTGTFGSLTQEYTPIYWWFQLSDPGQYPTMYEVHFAVDIALSGLPFATFATWHWDPEGDGSIPGAPVLPPHFDHDIPARFLVYHK